MKRLSPHCWTAFNSLDANGRAKSVITNSGEEISCQFVGLTAGVHPNIEVVKDSEIEFDHGILVNEYLETNIPGIFAIGDCAQFENPLPGRKAIEQVWYTGRMHVETLAQIICGKRKAYQPGPWFNSAKFFDIEYQVYGEVKNKASDQEDSIYWEHKNGKKSIRIAFEKSSTKLLGINLMGIRYRHEACDKWLREGALLKEVVANLKKAHFDPEFFKTHEHEIVNIYNEKFPANPIKSSSKRGLMAVFS